MRVREEPTVPSTRSTKGGSAKGKLRSTGTVKEILTSVSSNCSSESNFWQTERTFPERRTLREVSGTNTSKGERGWLEVTVCSPELALKSIEAPTARTAVRPPPGVTPNG